MSVLFVSSRNSWPQLGLPVAAPVLPKEEMQRKICMGERKSGGGNKQTEEEAPSAMNAED